MRMKYNKDLEYHTRPYSLSFDTTDMLNVFGVYRDHAEKVLEDMIGDSEELAKVIAVCVCDLCSDVRLMASDMDTTAMIDGYIEQKEQADRQQAIAERTQELLKELLKHPRFANIPAHVRVLTGPDLVEALRKAAGR